MIKKELRKQFLQLRLSLSLQEKHRLAAMMLEQFSAIAFHQIKMAMGYLAIEEKNELSPHFFEEMLEINNPDIQVCYPAANAENLNMTVFAANEDLEIGIGPYNIPQPISGKTIQPEQIDLIFVPLLAFDKKGFRVGYGKGYYDRFITHCKPNIITVGLSFYDAVETISDTSPFDIPLTHCITPNQVYVF